MATGRGRGFSQEDLDIRKIIEEAQTRWLKPPEVVEILRNYAAYGFKLNPVPPNIPPSGSLFLFDRKTLRYFRKDGHNWRKKKDGKTVREAHERLKAGSIDVLHCYYAHGEEDPSFQRRSYWMLEGAYEHIVLVHYLQVQGHRMGMYRQQESSTVPPVTGYYTPAVESASMPSPEIGSVSSELDDVDSSDDVEEIQPPQQVPTKSQPSLLHQLSKDWSSIYAETQQPNAPTQSLDDDIDLNDLLDNPDKFLGRKPLTPAVSLDNSGWSEILRECQTNESNLPNNVPTIPESNLPNVTVKQEFSWQDTLDQCTTPTTRQALLGQINDPSPRGIMDILSPRGLGREPRTVLEAQLRAATAENALKSMQTNSPTKRGVSPQMDVDRASQQMSTQQQSWNAFPQHTQPWQQQEYGINISDSPSGYLVPQNVVPSPGMKDAKAVQNLKPQDSFGRWIAEQIGEESPSVLLAPTHSDSGSFWMADTENSTAEMQLNVSVTLSQVQRFSITDFSPEWAFCDEEVKVLVSGTFLDTVTNPWDFNWCCMFGDVEVPAEIINVGVLRCKVPKHSPGRIPFYVTCSDRLACSEVREFEIRPRQEKEATGTDNKIGQLEKELVLQVRFAKFLLSASTEDSKEKLDSDIEEWKSLEVDIKARVLGPLATKEKLLELTFKDNLRRWLSARESASVLDGHGQGLLHLASALGYDWAVKPILDAGVVANFRDSRGWTALHWAAAFGREKTVVALLAAGTSPDLVADPTAKHPNGLMPSDLAAASGHKGIAGYLAEKALTRHLSSLTIADSNLNEISSISATLAGDDAAQSISTASYQRNDGRLALQRSLSAVRNATKAAALIHSAYRVDSFRKKNIEDEGGHDEYGMTAEEIQSMVAAQRIQRAGHRDKMVHSAALQIQRKFRGWKGRKAFLTLRKNVVKIQAHVRGHQVRKNFRKLLRVVSVIEKAVLRWRRKRVGLRGFSRPELADNTNGVNSDDDDFLKEARKQKEIALEKAVTRVQSMARSEEGREQYIRMLEGSRQAEEDYGRGGTKLEEDQVMTSAE